MNVGGALPPARGDLDDLVTSLVHEGARWAAPRTARRAVFGLGVARRATWFRHAAPIVTRGRHAFTEARKSTRIVAGAAATIRGLVTPSLVSGTPPSSIPCGVSSDLTRPSYPGAAPRSRPGASASGPLQLSASVCVNMPNLSYILPLHYTKPKLIDPPYRPVTLRRAKLC